MIFIYRFICFKFSYLECSVNALHLNITCLKRLFKLDCIYWFAFYRCFSFNILPNFSVWRNLKFKCRRRFIPLKDKMIDLMCLKHIYRKTAVCIKTFKERVFLTDICSMFSVCRISVTINRLPAYTKLFICIVVIIIAFMLRCSCCSFVLRYIDFCHCFTLCRQFNRLWGQCFVINFQVCDLSVKSVSDRCQRKYKCR